MAKQIFAANALTGGVAGALDDITDDVLEEGNLAIVIDTVADTTYFFKYSETEAGAESSPSIIIPDSNVSGTGAWVLVSVYSGDGTFSGDVDVVGSLTAGDLELGGAGATADEISTDGTLAGDSDTAIPTEKAVKTYVDNELLSQPVDNAIINGDMEIWQRGTTFTSPAQHTYSADRFAYELSGTMEHEITKSTDVPSSERFKASMKIDCTTTDLMGTTEYTFMGYRLEGYDIRRFVGQEATLSFWVKATKTGTYCVSFRSGGNDRSYVAEYTVSSADTWEKKEVTLTFNASGGTWDYEEGLGFGIYWTLGCGTNYQTTADAWQTGNYLGTSSQVNAMDSAVNNFFLTGVQLELGDTAHDFAFVPFADSLRRCQRYYCKSYEQADDPGTVTYMGCTRMRHSGSPVTAIYHTERWPVTMRINPDVTIISPFTGNDNKVYNLTTTADMTVNNVDIYSGESGFYTIALTAAPADADALAFHYTAHGEFTG